ncbi:embryonic polarity protein dorsal-like isoform X2 [Arctopsyche grandis]
MYNGGGPVPGPSHVPQPQHVASQHRQRNSPHVRIVEQPAPKSLRFRYECEGRSAGSIPGAHSTPENKTYPTIEIVGYKGRAVVVVSCVTKDEPYKPHPHNLVGKDGCKKGVCTVEINSESMTVSFSNLGIQCVKKKDIEDALKVREEIRVDPFKTGFQHRSQPTSIDLNAVRLCFQVFLEGRDKGKFTHPLSPIVSDIIFDKKAMSELVICKMSHCSASVAGGQEIILLCEKVAKEDISVRFYEEINGDLKWEGLGEFQHANVHKQVAIAFRTPRYRTLNVEQSVKVYIQLRRPSDGAISDPLPFELLPLDSGRTGLLSRRRKTDYSLINQILASNISQKIKHLPQNTSSTPSPIIIDGNNNSDEQTPSTTSTLTSVIERPISNMNGNITVDLTTPTEEVNKINNSNMFLQNEIKTGNNDKNLNELLDQVAELDQIYSDNQTRISNMTTTVTNNVPNISMDIDDFDDRNTYTSLQLAFRNPISIIEPEMSYEDIITHKGPIIDVMPLKRDTEEKLPPLPPKRIKKAPSVEVLRPRAQTLSSDQDVSNHQSPAIEVSRTQPLKQNSKASVTRSVDRLPTNLPAIPPKKRSFLSRIFNRKSKEKSPPRDGKPLKTVGRSASSISGQRPNRFKQDVTHTSLKGSSGNLSLGTSLRYTDSITHISLHGDDHHNSSPSLNNNHLAPLPPTDGDTILVAENVLAIDASALKKIQDNLDLTEAEHYALYMALAPHATVSEFDELSCYYSPVEGGKFQQITTQSNQESKI